MSGPTKKSTASLSEKVGAKADRKLKARRRPDAGLWFGLGMMGLVGWSVAVPVLIGTTLGLWLDKHYGEQRSWTLALLLTGLAIGCFTAWNWLSKEHKAMDDDEQ